MGQDLLCVQHLHRVAERVRHLRSLHGIGTIILHCRAQLVYKNQSCPWCRGQMEWQDLFGFLDGLKGAVGRANNPDELAELMSLWQEYEMTRSLADVRCFARDMVEDVTLCAHLDRALAEGNIAFMRDSAGLWCRFHAMIADGELV